MAADFFDDLRAGFFPVFRDDFLAVLPDDFFAVFRDDFFAVLRDDFLADFFGTLPPARRASDNPMAMACLRLVTFLPDPPLRNVPVLRSCIARFTFV